MLHLVHGFQSNLKPTLTMHIVAPDKRLVARYQPLCNVLSCFHRKETAMKWTTPKVTEVCIGMEINDYMPAEL
jgi:coenzyme PQQ precursor peptide PqqA